jgi:GH25 family lysozyme M1 (1,4-beta-N-acetylmuramidase)
MRKLAVIPLVFLLAQCRSASPEVSARPVSHRGGFTHVINVSSYDPKERQRSGRSFSEHDVSALRANGANALIARAGKGGTLDPKCAAFLASADRAGMLPGVYYRLQNHLDAAAQADQFVNRAQQIARSRSWNAPALLLCGDYDSHSRLSDILRFMDRVHQRTGVVPVTYLENSSHLKRLLATASPEAKAKLRRSPYWVALYSHDNGAGDPRDLVSQYSVWSDWSLWQYGGVEWSHGRSRAKVYCHGRYRFSPYFGDIDRPLERNVFRGSPDALRAFWNRHGLPLQ